MEEEQVLDGADVARAIRAADGGDAGAAEQLFTTLYSELHRMATRRRRSIRSPASAAFNSPKRLLPLMTWRQRRSSSAPMTTSKFWLGEYLQCGQRQRDA